MSKATAEEIAEELIDQYVLDGDFTVLDDYKYLFKKAMQAHTAQGLSELKERVEEAKGGDGEYEQAEFVKIDYVLQLIEEVSDE